LPAPQQVLDHVSRYTHRVAIANNRLIDTTAGCSFIGKTRDNSKIKIMDLDADEFIRRFLLHVLPEGFQRVRYYGFLANRDRRKELTLCRQLLGMQISSKTPSVKDYREHYQELTGRSLTRCPRCQQGQMVIVDSLPPALCRIPFALDSS
jgi:ribosomal protein S14